MNVLSLFDGMSCGQIALDRIGKKVDNYYASEIDKYAISVTQENFPDTVQLGSVTEISYKDGILTTENGEFNVGKIDLVMGGSPCQSFSRVGDGSGFDGKSKLFWDYVRIMKEVNPKYFLLENVVMKQEWEDVITEAMGVKPFPFNSKLISAQNRPRIFWTNIEGFVLPDDKGLVIEDVINCTFSAEYPNYLDLKFSGKVRKDMVKNQNSKASCLTASMYKGQISSFCKNDHGEIYKYTPKDCEILQTVPLDYTSKVSNTQRYKMLGNGWTVDAIGHIFKNLK